MTDSFMEEGMERLKKAIHKDDKVEMNKAQSLLESACNKRIYETEKREETLCLQKKVEKRKSNLTNFFQKKARKD